MPARVELPGLVALVARESDDRLDGDVLHGVEAVEQHRVEVLPSTRPACASIAATLGGSLPLTPIVVPARSASSVATPGLDDQRIDRGRTFDRDHDEVGVVGGSELHDLAERSARGELGVVLGDERVVGRREARRDLDVEAHGVVVALLVGDEDVDDRRGRREVEAGQVGDRAGGLVGGAAILGERLAGHDRTSVSPEALEPLASVVVVGGVAGRGGGGLRVSVGAVAAAGGEQGGGGDGEGKRCGAGASRVQSFGGRGRQSTWRQVPMMPRRRR